MARLYSRDKNLKPLPSPVVEVSGIPATAKLLDLKEASSVLTEQFGRGYSDRQLRRYISLGKWRHGVHYVRSGGFYKIYLPAVQQWVVNGDLEA